MSTFRPFCYNINKLARVICIKLNLFSSYRKSALWFLLVGRTIDVV